MTPKEAFYKVLERSEFAYVGHDDVDMVIKALTELEELKRYPTSEEVCEAIQEEYKIEKVVCENRRFYDKDDGETLVTCFICDGKLNIDFHDFIFSVDTLIKICRFYEGLEK